MAGEHLSIGQQLRELREQRGFRKSEVARLTLLHPRTIARIERGQPSSGESIARLEKLFGVILVSRTISDEAETTLTIGRILRTRRIKQGVKLQMIAWSISKTVSAWSRIERGIHAPREGWDLLLDDNDLALALHFDSCTELRAHVDAVLREYD